MVSFTRVALVFLLVCLAAVAQQYTISTFAGGGLPIGIPATSASLNVAPTDKDYVWNNKEGDTPALFNPVTKVTLDSASYDPNPPQGEVLVRSGAKLVPATPLSYSYR